MNITLEHNINRSGDSELASQGFGRIATVNPPHFDPATEQQSAFEYFSQNGFVVLDNCLSQKELDELNAFYDSTQIEFPDRWGLGNERGGHHEMQGLIYSQPLLDHPELDPYTQHPSSYPLVCQLFGGEDKVRFSEFNFREVPVNAGTGAMNFHHDKVLPSRLRREPYMPCDYISAVHYLTDVKPGTPTFCVVPNSRRFDTLREVYEDLGDDYWETPIYANAGSCVLFDSATFHTRYDGDGYQGRRTWHQYYERGGFIESTGMKGNKFMRSPSPALTDWNLFPKRLALHPDPKKKLYFSHWNSAQCEWAASDFDDKVRASTPVYE